MHLDSAKSSATEEPVKRKHEFTMYQLLAFLKKKKNFYARIISRLEIIPTTSVGTMAVSIANNKHTFLYNPTWFQTVCTAKEALMVVEHEALHLVLQHIPRYILFRREHLTMRKNLIDAVANIGMDEAANSFLLAEHGVVPANGINPSMFNHPPGKSTEWYIQKQLSRMEDMSDDQIKQEVHVDKLTITDDDTGTGDQLPQDTNLVIDENTEIDDQRTGGKDETKPKGDQPNSTKLDGQGPQEEDSDPSGDGSGKTGRSPEDPEEDSRANNGSEEGDDTVEDAAAEGEGDEVASDDDKEGDEDKLSHTWTDKINEMTEEELNNAIDPLERHLKRIVQQAVNEAVRDDNASCGNLPGSIKAMLDKLLEAPKIPWEQLFREQIQVSINNVLERHMGRPNRRMLGMGISPFPGKKLLPSFNILFAIDTSGSMSDADVSIALATVEDILKINPDIECTVLMFDQGLLGKPYQLKGGQREIIRERCGYGGTDLNPPFAYAFENTCAFDLFIVATDGYVTNPREEYIPHNKPIIWLMTKHHSKPFDGNLGTYLTLE